MGMPTLTDLQGMYGLGDPRAYMQARDNAGLERQFREQQYAQEQEKAREASLKNLWAQEDRPRNIEKQTLTNRNLDYTGLGTLQDNRTKTVEADVAEAGKPFQLNEQQRKELLAISTHDISMGKNTAIQMMQHPTNEAIRARGKQLYEFTEFAQNERLKHVRAKELVEIREKGDTARNAATNYTTLEATRLRERGANERAATKTKPGGVDFWSSYYKMKSARDKHSSLVAEARKIMADSPEEAQKMLAMAEDIRPQAEAEIPNAFPKPGSLDTGAATGMETNPRPSIAPPSGSVDPKKTQGVKSLADLQGMYPGVPAAKLKELYKKKFGVDLQ